MTIRRCVTALVLLSAILAAGASAGPPDQKAAPPVPVLTIGSTRFRHAGSLDHGVVGPDGKTLYALSGDGDVTTWDLETGAARRLFADDRLRNSLHVSPDGTRLLSISRDDAGIWDARTGREVRRLGFGAGEALFRADGKAVVVFREGRVDELPDNGPAREVGRTAEYVAPAVSPDGRWFAAAGPGREPDEVVVFDARTVAPLSTLKLGRAGFGPSPSALTRVRLGFAPDGKTVVAAATDGGGLAVWDVATANVVRDLKPGPGRSEEGETRFTALLYSADGKTVFAGTAAGTIRRWDVTAGTELAPLRGHRASVTTLLPAKGGAWLVSLCKYGTVRRWDVATGKEVEPLDGYTGNLHAAVSPDGKAAVVVDATGKLDVWDLGTGKRRAALRPAGGVAPGLTPQFGFLGDGSRVYLADPGAGTVSVWASDGKPESTAATGTKGQKGGLRFCAPAPDGRSFAVNRGYNRVARIDAATGKEIWVSDELFPKGSVHPAAFAPDGRSVLLGAIDFKVPPGSPLNGKLELVRLDAGTGKVLNRVEVESASAGSTTWFTAPQFSADGRRLALGYGDVELTVFDAATLKPVRRHGTFASTLSPDGTWVAGASLGSIAAYDAESGDRRFEVPLPPGWVSSLAVLPDGRRAITSGAGGVAYLWDLPRPVVKDGK